MRNEHLVICEKDSEKMGVEFGRRMEQELRHYRELAMAELKTT
jgi:hypothetical protein